MTTLQNIYGVISKIVLSKMNTNVGGYTTFFSKKGVLRKGYTNAILIKWMIYLNCHVSYVMTIAIKLFFGEIMMPVLYWTNTQSWIFIVLVVWNNSPMVVEMSLHYYKFPCQLANPSSLLLLNDVYVPGGEDLTIYHTRGKHDIYAITEACDTFK